MFILDTDHISLFQRRDAVVSARVLATPAVELAITVMAFDEQAQTHFNRLRAQRQRVGTQDLRIAAIALSQEAILVTRNRQDFVGIPSLQTEDWS